MTFVIITYLTSAVLGLGVLRIVRRYRHESEQKRLRVFAITMVVLIGAVAMMGWVLSRHVVLKTIGVG